MSDVKKYINDAVKNITEDREVTRELLNDAIKWLAKDESRHREIGIVLAKYVETLQRSNEQLVKLAALVQKSERGEAGISEEDKQELFDLINQPEEND